MCYDQIVKELFQFRLLGFFCITELILNDCFGSIRDKALPELPRRGSILAGQSHPLGKASLLAIEGSGPTGVKITFLHTVANIFFVRLALRQAGISGCALEEWYYED